MLKSDQMSIINVAASGFDDVWADQILMEGEFADRIGAEYLASVPIPRKLAAEFPEGVRVFVGRAFSPSVRFILSTRTIQEG